MGLKAVSSTGSGGGSGPTTNPVSVAQGGTASTTTNAALDTLTGNSSTVPTSQFTVRQYNTNTSTSSYIAQNLFGINLDPSLLPNWRFAMSQVKKGAANCRILVIGDSETIGVNAAGAATPPNWTAALAAALLDAKIPTNNNGFFGDSTGVGNLGVRSGTDPRIAIGSWTSASPFTTGGAIFNATTTGTPFVYTPGIPIDTFNVFYNTGTGLGSWTITPTGASATAINSNGTSLMNIATVTSPTVSPTNTVSLNFVSGGTVFMEGLEAYNSKQASVNIMNAGWWGSNSTQWIASGAVFNPLATVGTIAAPLVIIRAGANDWKPSGSGGTSIATFTANIQQLISKAKATGDVVLAIDAPNTSVTQVIQEQYVQVLYSLAESNSIPLVDDFNRWISFAVSNAAGFYSDAVHPNGNGYLDWGSSMATFLLSVAGGGNDTSVASLTSNGVVRTSGNNATFSVDTNPYRTLLFAQTATSTVANTTTETSLFSTGVGSATIAAALLIPGKTISVIGGGIFSTTITPGNLTIKVKMGGVTIATGTITNLVGSQTNDPFEIGCQIVCYTNGATGTVMVNGNMNYQSGTLQRGFVALNNTGATTTINTTTSNLIDISATWATANASNSISMTTCNVEITN